MIKGNSQIIMNTMIIFIYLLNGFFFNTLSVQSANRFPSFLNSYRSRNERKVIISSITSFGKSSKDFCFKLAILFWEINWIFSSGAKNSAFNHRWNKTKNCFNVINKTTNSLLSDIIYNLQHSQAHNSKYTHAPAQQECNSIE